MNERSLELPAIVGLTDDQRYDLLASERRRVAIEALAQAELPLTIEEAAEAIATREDDTADPRPETVEEVKISLHHVHMPKLDDADVVDYDPAENRITGFQREIGLQTN